MAKRKKPSGWRQGPNFLAAWRERAALTQEQAGGAIDVDKSMISKIETGRASYQAYHLEKLAHLYKCKPGDLISTDPSVTPTDETGRLRAALLAYGVDHRSLDQVLGIIGTFTDAERPKETPTRDDNQSANPRRIEEPSR